MGTVHIVGAGMAGLSCAVDCVKAGKSVAIYEASPQAGGRCRSFMDESMGCMIDNGTHMLLGSNEATKLYLKNIGSRELVSETIPAKFPFLNPKTGTLWKIKPGSPYFPFWLMNPRRRVPGTNPISYLKGLRLARARTDETVEHVIGREDPLYETFWQPICRAALNTDANDASALLLWRVVKIFFLNGEKACRPISFEKGLSATLVDPALEYLSSRNTNIRYKERIRNISWKDNLLTGIRSLEGFYSLGKNDAVVLAVPPDICAGIWPDITPLFDTSPIINVHFRVNEPVVLPGDLPFLGLIGTNSQWIFTRGEVLSITVSAASKHVDRPNSELANDLWSEINRILGYNLGHLPPWRVIKERRATIAQTPKNLEKRPGATTSLKNLFLAGDWTDTGLPATIEGSIQSGLRAARLAMIHTSKFGKK